MGTVRNLRNFSERLPELAEDVSSSVAEVRQVTEAAAGALIAVMLLSVTAVVFAVVALRRTVNL
jgi:hypothetical protein